MPTAWATLADVPNFGIPADAYATLTVAQRQGQLNAANGLVDSYLRDRYGLDTTPATSWGVELTEAACVLFARGAMGLRGYNPGNGNDLEIGSRADAKIRWLEQVQHRSAHPLVVQAVAPAAATVRPTVISSSMVSTGGDVGPRRGW